MRPDLKHLITSALLASSLAGVLLGTLVGGCVTTTPMDTSSDAPPPMLAAAKPPPPQEISQRKTTEQQLAELNQMVAALNSKPRLGKADILNISVYDEPDLTMDDVPVRPDGHISFPLVGDVLAEGRTVDELTADLTHRLGQYLLSPKVTVVVQQFNSLNYTIAGEVVKPGVYPLQTNVSLVDAVAKAGGLNKGQYRASSVELADLTHAFVSREGKVLPVDFVRLLRQGDMRFNIQMQSGDYISIPSGLSKEVYVIGEVNLPNLFAFREEMPLSRTVAIAEGFTQDADLSRIHVIRGSLSNPTLIVADYNKVIAGQAQDVQLEPGDIVFVPATGLATWARMLDKIVPTITALQTGIVLQSSLSNSKSSN
ncbi:MAG: polysaccharide biosynthesis/export family protein [Chromatiaceae bacterium]